MVYFNCCSCNTGLRKNQVEQHRFSCGSRMFSCIDCSKDFRNEEYKLHVKCITESEKYESKSSFVSKANKGDLKQNAWLEKVGAAVETFRGSQRARQLLEKLVDYPNVPRKKPKFFNFMMNSFRSYGVNESQLNEIWSVIEEFDKKTANNENQNLKRKIETIDTTIVSQVKQQKLDSNRITEETVVNESDENNSFDWTRLIKDECCKHSNNEIDFKKLEKKIYKKYEKFLKSCANPNDDAEQADSIRKKFNKKLNKKLQKNASSFILTRGDDEQQEKAQIVKYIDVSS